MTSARIWQRHERAVAATLEDALTLLACSDVVDLAETVLTRELYHCLNVARRNRKLNGLPTLSHPITYEACNPPDPSDPERVPRERKIPDFQCSFYDDAEPDARASAKHFIVECKRIGPPARANWIFTRNYVEHGIRRFRVEDHGYGKGSSSGVMVAFVQGLELEGALEEVNAYAHDESIPAISGHGGSWTVAGVTWLAHEFVRSYPISPFLLKHAWLDIRTAVANRRRLRRSATARAVSSAD